MTDNVDNFLEHYGVKGMKWGVRRNQVKAGLKKNGKKIAVGVGIAAAAASLAAGSAYISKRYEFHCRNEQLQQIRFRGFRSERSIPIQLPHRKHQSQCTMVMM